MKIVFIGGKKMITTVKKEADEKTKWNRLRSNIMERVYKIFIERNILLFSVCFLLGRAIILYEVSPFVISLLATIWIVHRKKTFPSIIFMLLGAWTYSLDQTMFVSLSFIVFLIFAFIFQNKTPQLRYMMLLVFLSTTLTRMFFFSILSTLSIYEWLLLIVEGILAIVLLLIFMQSIPLLSLKRYRPALQNEEIVSIVILLASILTGMIGWEIYSASIEHIFSRYFVLIISFVGGAAIGSTVGVVTGLILSLANVANLYQMSLLAFSGLLGGLLKEGNKVGVSIGLLIGTFLVGLYGESLSLFSTMIESLFAIVLFFLTPKSFLHTIAKFIPGTPQYVNEERKHLQKVRGVTAKRVEQFSNVFEALSKSFIRDDHHSFKEDERETDYFLSIVTEKTCQVCYMKEQCWQSQFDETYSLLKRLKENIVYDGKIDADLNREFRGYCIKPNKMVSIIEEEASVYELNKKIKRQVQESKRIVADQLQGVSEVMDHFAKEIVKEREYYEKQEEEIVIALQQASIQIEKVTIYHLEKGNIDIDMTLIFNNYHGEGPKLIAPILSNIFNETIIVCEEEISPFPNGVSFLSFSSARQFVVESGFATAARGGGLISGDSFQTMELGKGKFALAISDGMGNGKRAQEESSETLRLLRKILQSGISEKVAIRSINSILALRTTDEIFATLDLVIMNLHNAHVRFIKIGSSPSFIKRHDEVIQVEANNLPIGIVDQVELDVVHKQLKHGDIIIMMSDGVYEGPKNVKNYDYWIKRKIKNIKTEDPQEIADVLLEEVVRHEHGVIDDDMTVVVAKVKKHIPKWATIPIYRDEAQ